MRCTSPYPWSRSVSWCLAESEQNGNQRHQVGPIFCIVQTCSCKMSVHLSVIPQYSVETAQHIVKLLSPWISQSCSMRCYGNIPTGTPEMGASNAGGMKNCDFRKMKYLGNDTRYGHSYQLPWNANRTPQPSFQMVPFSMTLNDP